MIVASIVAIFQHNVKRMLAYSSVAQIGYMLLGIGLLNVNGLTATLLHLFNHALIKGALFMALGAICYRIGNTEISNLGGIAKQMPWTIAAFFAGGLSLIGVPFTAGFVSKWYLILAALDKGWWLIIVAIIISSLLAVTYIFRVIETVYFKPRPEDAPIVTEAPLGLLIPTWILVLLNVYFGTAAGLTSQYAGQTARMLLGS